MPIESISSNTTEGGKRPHLAGASTMAEHKRGTRTRAPLHPGRIAASVLADNGLSIRDAAKRIGVSHGTLSNVLKEKDPAAMTPDMALRIGTLFGNGPEIWLGLQADYDLFHARAKIKAQVDAIETIKTS